MSVIKKIIRRERRVSAKGEYFVTLARLEDGSEIEGYGVGFEVGDTVNTFFDDRFNKAKMVKAVDKPLVSNDTLV